MILYYFKKSRLFILFLMVTGFISCQESNRIMLIENGKSDYKIIISKDADSITHLAANEFQKYLLRISGSDIEILSDTSIPCEKEVIIGNNTRLAEVGIDLSDLHEDGFIIKSVDKKLIIAGGVEKGTLYGVYTFLEEYLGCRKYSMDFTFVPESKFVSLEPINVKEEPAFDFRELHMPHARWDTDYRNWHKLDLKEGKNEWGLFVHTFDDFIPAETYFKNHPEYFSYLNVKRIPDGQLCLSNPNVFRIVVDSLKARMVLKPEALYWSVSQNDTYKACECDNCKEEYQLYGGYSGAMINFVNKVAEVFPDKIISTLAYQYTRSAPTNIKPADNVNIMFCSIECNRSRPLSTDEGSSSFRKDMEDWYKLTNNIFMWDYVVQFRNLVSPFPNFRVLQPNIQYFRDNGIKMMFQQGSGGLISEFVELRSYIIAKLLWNPDADVDRIIEDFTDGYYGPAGKYIREYIKTMHDALDDSGGYLGIYGYPYDGINTYLTPGLIQEYEQLFDKAENAVSGNPEFLEHVKIASLPLEFAILDISLRNVNEDLSFFKKEDGQWIVKEEMISRLSNLTEQAIKSGMTRYWEHGNYPDDYKATVERYARSSMQNHLALNKPVELLTEFSEKYPVGGGVALTDGLKGINDYHFNWLGFEGPDVVAIIDLEDEKVISTIEMDFLQEIKSWVFLPEQVEYFFSLDGESYKSLDVILNNTAKEKSGTFIQSFRSEFEPIKARFIKVVATNMGVCPNWHPGAGYPSWIFCDEVIVW